jgi:nicotinamide-nucleotide amidase
MATGECVTTAESCTGGYIAKVLTDIAGSSEWFEGGVICYSNAAKVRQLGVSKRLLARHGAVSAAVARAMARGAMKRAGVARAVAVTGIAGPTGAVPGKPIGTVWFGFAGAGAGAARVRVVRRRFRGGRDAVRRQAVAFALRQLARP